MSCPRRNTNPRFNSLKLATDDRLAAYAKKLVARWIAEEREIEDQRCVVYARIVHSHLDDWIEDAGVGCWRYSDARDTHYLAHCEHPAYVERGRTFRALVVKAAKEAGVLCASFVAGPFENGFDVRSQQARLYALAG